MWKVLSLLFLLPIMGQSALVTARCRYFDHQAFGYTCEASNLQFMMGDELQITGVHMPGRNNGNILTVEIVNSTVEVAPLQFFISFPNLNRFNAQNVGMSNLNPIRNCENLQSLRSDVLYQDLAQTEIRMLERRRCSCRQSPRCAPGCERIV